MTTLRLCACLAAAALAAGEPAPAFADPGVIAPNHHPGGYKAWSFPDCDNLLRQEFLPKERLWERIDLWIPKDGGDRLPCAVFLYGGGYGGKVAGFKNEARLFIDAGYAVAMPDYVIGAQEPVPITVWDAAHAVRWLRSNARRLRIDPERIGVLGWSAGGWIIQNLAPSDGASRTPVRAADAKDVTWQVPLLDPHPELANVPLRVQAGMTDWAAGRLNDDNRCKPNGRGGRQDWLSADDPPMLTCIAGGEEVFSGGMKVLKDLGVPCAVAALGEVGLHVPKWSSPAAGGGTWQDRILAFFAGTVKNPTQASAPEATPAGGPLAGPTPVTLRCVHERGAIHYTLDGSAPTTASPRASGPVTVAPGQTLKAIAVSGQLAPSRVLTATYASGPAAPVITTSERAYTHAAGTPLRLAFTADQPVRWAAIGKLPGTASDDGKKLIATVSMDPATGVLSGTPKQPGGYHFIVLAQAGQGDQALVDAVRVSVVVQ